MTVEGIADNMGHAHREAGAGTMFWLLKRIRRYQGYDKYSAETVDRLIRSKHVKDLRSVALAIALFAVLATVVIVLIAVVAYGFSPGSPPAPVADGRPFSKLYEALVPFQISAVVAAVGGVLAWCYKIGSNRLGIIDLFSCEMTTLCRICTINGSAHTCIEAFKRDNLGHDWIRERFTYFESSEAYTPIFDANAKELQSLDVKVVINITAFYTYWKATGDAFRKAAPLNPATAAAQESKNGAWDRAMRHVLYMHFLTLESARKAVRDLIEFEPNNAENTITILLSELPAYHFLLNSFPPNDVRHARLELRRGRYREVVQKVYYLTVDEHEKYGDLEAARKRYPARKGLDELCRDWNKAYRMLDELKSRYEAAIGPFPRRPANGLIPKKASIRSALPHSSRAKSRPARAARSEGRGSRQQRPGRITPAAG
jgi:hypothetical protein